jgi:drug/metabolite transporter (DMT)-like permease
MDTPAYRRNGAAYIVVSAICFGTMAIMARVAYAAGVDTTTLLALRFTLAAVILVAIALVRRERWPKNRTLFALILLGALGYGGQSFTFFTALTLAPAGLVALLLYLYPALVTVLSTLVLREKLTRRKLAALAIALFGTALTIGPTAAASPLGIALGVGAAAIYAVYIVAGSRLGARVAPRPMATVVVASAGAVFAVAALARGPVWPQTPSGWLAVVGIAVLSTVVAIVLFFAGLERIGPTRAAVLSTIEPLCTVLLAAVFLGERIAPWQLIGGALILTAVVLLARGSEDELAA